jgi:membrane-associated phospholipid phosphatase
MRTTLAYTSARILLLVVSIILLSLIGVRFHYFTDTVGGAALGIGTVCGLALVLDLPTFRRWLARDSGQPPVTWERRNASGRTGG